MPQFLSPISIATPAAGQGTLFTSPTSSLLAQLSKRIVIVALALIAVAILAITAHGFLRRRPIAPALPPAPPPLLAPAPAPPPAPPRLTDAIRALAKQKVESLCLECLDTHIIQFAGVGADGTVFAFGAHKENPVYEKTLFVCRPSGAKLQPHAPNPACTLRKNPDNACGTLFISIEAKGLRATICAFPHQGFHAQQKLNGLPMEQVECLSLARLKALVNTLVDSATHKCFSKDVLNLIDGYAVDDREHSKLLIDETRGVVQLSDTRNSSEVMSIRWHVYGVPVVVNQNNDLLGSSKSFQLTAKHVSGQPDIIELSATEGVPSHRYIDLQTYVNDFYRPNLRSVKIYPFLRPKVPLTPREVVRLIAKLPARDFTSIIILPRLGYGLARTAVAAEALHIKPGMREWEPAELNLTYLTEWESVKVDWLRFKNKSPFAELSSPWSSSRGNRWETLADEPIVDDWDYYRDYY